MFQSFITSLDANEAAARQKREQLAAGTGKDSKLREIIKSMIVSMMNSQEICVQAALNIGLPSNLLDFERLLKFVNSETNPNSLNFTYMQLKTLQKQCNKLKKSMNYSDLSRQNVRTAVRQQARKPTFLLANDDSSKKAESHDRLKQAIEEELQLRNRLKLYNSTDKIARKQQILKKKVEKAKSMNKRAFKIYKNHKEKQEKSYDYFKIETLYHNSQTEIPKQEPLPPNIRPKKHISSLEQDESNDKSMDLLKVSIMRDEFGGSIEKCKTAGVRTRTRYIVENQNESIIKRTNNDRFLDYKRKELQTREKKIEIERSKEEQALYRLIKKNERLNQLQQKNEQQQEKQFKKVQKIHQESLNKHPIQQLREDFDVSIKDKCEEKVMKKEMQLQEQVNRIREELRSKDERRERHRMKKEKQHEEKMSLNETYLKNYLGRCKQMKENDFRHEMTIKQRHEMLLEKENQAKIINNLSKFSEQQLMRSIQRLKKAENSKSLFNLNQA